MDFGDDIERDDIMPLRLNCWMLVLWNTIFKKQDKIKKDSNKEKNNENIN